MEKVEKQLLTAIKKMNILVETICWGEAALRSNEISLAHKHLRDALNGFEPIIKRIINRERER